MGCARTQFSCAWFVLESCVYQTEPSESRLKPCIAVLSGR